MARKIEDTTLTEALGNYFHDVYELAAISKRTTINGTRALHVVMNFPQMIIHYWNTSQTPQACFDAIMRD